MILGTAPENAWKSDGFVNPIKTEDFRKPETKQVLFVIKDKHGHQLSRPNPDADELWDRIEGKPGLMVVAYTGKEESLEEDLEQESKDSVAFSSVLTDLINQEYELLNAYDSAQVTFEMEGTTKFSEIFNYIADDINIHIGMLQSCIEDLDPSAEKIEDGKEQADELMNESLIDDLHNDFELGRRSWSKLGKETSFDDAIRIYNETSPNAEKDWYSKPLYSKEAWDEMVDMVESLENAEKDNKK